MISDRIRSRWIIVGVICALVVCSAGAWGQESEGKSNEVSHAEVLLRRARNQANAGNYSEAAEFFIAALKLKDSPAVRKEIAGVLIKDEKVSDAEKWLGDLIYGDDNVAKWLVGGYITTGKLADAQRVLEAIVQQKPESFFYRLWLAEVMSWRKEYVDSITLYRELIQEKPTAEKPFLAFLDVLFWANRYDEYLEESAKYLERRPEELSIRSRRLDLLMARNEFGRAADECREMLKLEPESKTFRMRLAQILSWDGRYDESEKLYEELVASHPDDPVLAKGLGEVRVWATKYEEAVKPLKAALKARPRDPQVRRLLAITLGEVRKVSAADQGWLRDIAAELAASKDLTMDILFHAALARALRKVGEYDLSINLLEKVLVRWPQSRAVRLQFADTLSAAGRFEEAEKEYDFLLQAQPRKETPR